MQIRQVSALILGTYTDSILNLSYLKILTHQQYESVKLPTSASEYKNQHLLKPNFLLEMELVKTRKNWILKQIIGYREITSLREFADFQKIAKMYELLSSYMHEGQEIELLPFLLQYFGEHDLQSLSLPDFELEIMIQLGFAHSLEEAKQKLTLSDLKRQII